MNQAYFHLVRDLESLKSIASRLYGGTESATAKEFLRFNAAVATEGQVWPGNLLFLPEPICYDAEIEAQIAETLRLANGRSLRSMPMPERQFLAANHVLADNTAKGAEAFHDGLNIANTTTSTLLASASVQSKIMGASLRKLETKYLDDFRKNGKLTQHFFVERQRAYKSLDTALGRLSRTLTMGTPYSESAKSALNINTKRQVLHWKRKGTGDGVKDFARHFEKMQKRARFFKYGGYLTIAIDGYITYETIVKACEENPVNACTKAKIVEGGGFVGRVGGATAGGMAAYGACSAAFGVPTAGTSLLWCGIIAGGALGLGGAATGNYFGRGIGTFIYEKSHSGAP